MLMQIYWYQENISLENKLVMVLAVGCFLCLVAGFWHEVFSILWNLLKSNKEL
jgi:hypothetical protein